jgi:divalent metal cation (Fe/Co/Zn/Cd) transporter
LGFDSVASYCAQCYIVETKKGGIGGILPLPLIERSEEEIAGRIKRKVEQVKNVRSCDQISVRISGKRLDVNLLLRLDENLRLEEAHKVAADVEREIVKAYPNARVAISTESVSDSEKTWKAIKDIADGMPGSRGVHNIHIQKIGEKLAVDLHLEVSANMTVKQAHDVADQLEKTIKKADPSIAEATIHIETASERVSRELAGVEAEMESHIKHVAKDFSEVKDVSGIEIRRFGREVHLVLRCRFDPNLSIEKAHEVTNKIEKTLRTSYPNVTRIDIHEEPA